ncbi:T9SS type A sorting domain-containing protein [Flavobacterium sp. RHBU_3]|uniref:T9SS type A sorting domain-containing protein n=1 Tax=Flavobacterium sp. RHBU_3 TaxID=3391184 RepID=UPI003984CA75
MKRFLLAGCLFLAFFTANAQLTFSFEEAEGFTTGDITGQSSYWGTFSDTDPMEVSSDYANDGENSLKFSAPTTNDYTGGYLYFNNPYTNYSISMDVLTDAISSSGTGFQISGLNYASSVYTTASTLYFYYASGGIYVFYGDGDSDYQLIGSVDAEVWTNIKVEYNVDNNEIYYYVNEELVFTSAFYEGVPVAVNLVQFLADDGDTSWYIDNVVVAEATAAVAVNTKPAFSVYPNPATDVVNVSAGNATINAVSFTDINGRVVKTQQMSATTTAQVSIADLATGVYVMNITSDSGTISKKVIKN